MPPSKTSRPPERKKKHAKCRCIKLPPPIQNLLLIELLSFLQKPQSTKKLQPQKLPNEILLMIGDAANDRKVWEALSLCSKSLYRCAEPALYRNFIQTGRKGTAIKGFISAIAAKPHRANFIRHITARYVPEHRHYSGHLQEFVRKTVRKWKSSAASSVPFWKPNANLCHLNTFERDFFDSDFYIALLIILSARNLESLTILDINPERFACILEVMNCSIAAQMDSRWTGDCLAKLHTIKLDIASEFSTTKRLLFPFACLPSLQRFETNAIYLEDGERNQTDYPKSNCTHAVFRQKEKTVLFRTDVGIYIKRYPRLKSFIYMPEFDYQARRMRSIKQYHQRPWYILNKNVCKIIRRPLDRYCDQWWKKQMVLVLAGFFTLAFAQIIMVLMKPLYRGVLAGFRDVLSVTVGLLLLFMANVFLFGLCLLTHNLI